MLSPLLLSAAVLLAEGQAPPQGQALEPGPRPGWVETLPEAHGRFYAMGMADLGTSEAQALKLAGDRARLEVVARLRTSVQGGTATVTQTTETRREGAAAAGYGQRTTRDEVKVKAQAEDLAGLVVERTYLDLRSRTAYALAYLDVAQARGALTARLEAAVEARQRVGDTANRLARWQLRRVQGDLNRMDELSGLLASAGSFASYRAGLEKVRVGVAKRLSQLEAMDLPPMELAKSSMSLRVNVNLPGGIQDSLEACLAALGPKHRNAGADFLLELTFGGGDKGPEFLFTEMSFASGAIYRLEADLRILEARGTPLTKSNTLSLSQAGTPEGLVEQFRRAFERKLIRLLEELQSELR